ncbi:MAG TPA: hypothetical protein VFE58_09100 [Tepidisphaeraceae bacterium]|nr:hypothetical protein [Tepidisphaeraceae bacterium]
MKQRFYGWCCVAIVVLMSPAMTFARQYQEEREIVDARLESYEKVISLPGSGTALLWLLLLFLTGVTVAVMFKDAKRSHLD